MRPRLRNFLLLLVICAGCRARVQALASSASAPSALAFGGVQVGGSKSRKLAVTNESQEELALDVEVSAPFSVSQAPHTVPGSGSAELEVVFAPSDGQSYDQTLTLHVSATDTPTLPVHLTGKGLMSSGGQCDASSCRSDE